MKRFLLLVATAVFGSVLVAGPASASPTPPTNGGNGGGQSGQCTGPQDDRPASCNLAGRPGSAV